MEISQINEGLQKQCKQKLSNQCQYNKPTSKICPKFKKKKYVFFIESIRMGLEMILKAT